MTAEPNPDPGAGLVCEGLAAAPGGVLVLRDVDLHVPAGTLTVVVGPSGAGKTTLLRSIAGLAPVERGRIRLADRELTGLTPRQRQVAMVFQQPRLFPALDVAGNVAFPLRVAGVPRGRRRERARSALADVGLDGFAERRVRGLSGGEQQRVGLARALAADPDLLMLDEPLASVDPERREALRRLVHDVQRARGVTALYVTHDRTEAAELGDRVAVMLEGRIVQVAPPRELFERPRSTVVARFLGSTNLLTGRIEGGRLPTAFGPVRVRTEGVATVTFRPEAIHLTEDGPLRATVVEATYVGSATRLVLEEAGQRLEATVAPDAAPPVGSRVDFDVPPARVWPIPDADGRAARDGADPQIPAVERP